MSAISRDPLIRTSRQEWLEKSGGTGETAKSAASFDFLLNTLAISAPVPPPVPEAPRETSDERVQGRAAASLAASRPANDRPDLPRSASDDSRVVPEREVSNERLEGPRPEADDQANAEAEAHVDSSEGESPESLNDSLENTATEDQESEEVSSEFDTSELTIAPSVVIPIQAEELSETVPAAIEDSADLPIEASQELDSSSPAFTDPLDRPIAVRTESPRGKIEASAKPVLSQSESAKSLVQESNVPVEQDTELVTGPTIELAEELEPVQEQVIKPVIDRIDMFRGKSVAAAQPIDKAETKAVVTEEPIDLEAALEESAEPTETDSKKGKWLHDLLQTPLAHEAVEKLESVLPTRKGGGSGESLEVVAATTSEPAKWSDSRDLLLVDPVKSSVDPVTGPVVSNVVTPGSDVHQSRTRRADIAHRPAALSAAEYRRFQHRIDKAFELASQRDGEIRLRLSPPQLGSLKVELKLDGEVMHARLETETDAARQLIVDSLPGLRDRLAEQGIRIETFEVDLYKDQSSSQDQQRDQQFNRDRPRAHQVEPSRDEMSPLQSQLPYVDGSGLDVKV